MGVKKVGELKNGMAVHTWFWNKQARKLGLKYNDPLFGALNDRSSLSAVGLLTDEIKKFHPQAIFIGPDGYEHIDEKVLKEKDSISVVTFLMVSWRIFKAFLSGLMSLTTYTSFL